MTAQLPAGPFLPCLHSLSCFSNEIKNPVTLLWKKTGKTTQTHPFGNAGYIRTFNLLHKKKKEGDIKHNLAKTADKHITQTQNPVSKIESALI